MDVVHRDVGRSRDQLEELVCTFAHEAEGVESRWEEFGAEACTGGGVFVVLVTFGDLDGEERVVWEWAHLVRGEW